MNPFAVTETDREAAEQFLHARIDYERGKEIPYGKRDFKLDRMVRFLARLGNPHVGVNIVHIAGTKGKGSTAAMVAAILSAAGYRTGLYTSPHLLRVEERMRIDGEEVSAEAFFDLIERVRPVVAELDEHAAAEIPSSHGPTYFEVVTAMALVYFADRRVDWAVLEVGLGGRLDSTNVCLPAVSVITSISFDHMRQLGNTLSAIAAEKAGIIKPGVPVISGVTNPEARDVIRSIATERGCKLRERGVDFDAAAAPGSNGDARASAIDFRQCGARDRLELAGVPLPLLGSHQVANAAVALATIDELRAQNWDIDDDAIRRGLARLQLPARVQLVGSRPTVVLDVAHNVASVGALLESLESSLISRRRILLFATTRDKDARGMLELLLPRFDEIILTRYQVNPRGIPVEELAAIAAELQPGNGSHAQAIRQIPLPETAWQTARELAGPEDLIAITGSFFIAAEMMRLVGELR
jgi:dihydrofolate synthase/folylpolyglutamate synthase